MDLEEIIGARMALLEAACEQALQGGEHGVLVDSEGTAVVSDTVPYGYIYRLPVKLSV